MAKERKAKMLGQLVLTARASRTALSSELAAIGLYPGQDAVLLALAGEEGMTLRALAARLQVKPPTVTKTIARLSGQGFLEKRPSPDDARQSTAHLTEEGRRLVDRIRQAQGDVADRALTGLRKKDRQRLAKLLARMERNLVDEPQQADESEAEPLAAEPVEPPKTVRAGHDVPSARRARVRLPRP